MFLICYWYSILGNIVAFLVGIFRQWKFEKKELKYVYNLWMSVFFKSKYIWDEEGDEWSV